MGRNDLPHWLKSKLHSIREMQHWICLLWNQRGKAGLTRQRVAEQLLRKSPSSPEKQFSHSDSGTLLKHFHFYPNQYKWSHPFQKSIIWLQLKLRSVILKTLGFCVLVQWLPCPTNWFGSWSRCCRTHWEDVTRLRTHITGLPGENRADVRQARVAPARQFGWF